MNALQKILKELKNVKKELKTIREEIDFIFDVIAEPAPAPAPAPPAPPPPPAPALAPAPPQRKPRLETDKKRKADTERIQKALVRIRDKKGKTSISNSILKTVAKAAIAELPQNYQAEWILENKNPYDRSFYKNYFSKATVTNFNWILRQLDLMEPRGTGPILTPKFYDLIYNRVTL